MDLTTVLTNIKNWDNIRKNSKQVSDLFDGLNYFNITFPYSVTHTVMNTYIGYNQDKEQIEIYSIPESLDSKTHEGSIMSNIIVSSLGYKNFRDIQYDPLNYKERLALWENDITNWLTDNCGTRDGIFRAFKIPCTYMSNSNSYDIYFGLKERGTPITKISDLIIVHETGSTNTIDDNVSSYPPLKNGNFHLMSMADN